MHNLHTDRDIFRVCLAIHVYMDIRMTHTHKCKQKSMQQLHRKQKNKQTTKIIHHYLIFFKTIHRIT